MSHNPLLIKPNQLIFCLQQNKAPRKEKGGCKNEPHADPFTAPSLQLLHLMVSKDNNPYYNLRSFSEIKAERCTSPPPIS
jgi:hypothetical protein